MHTNSCTQIKYPHYVIFVIYVCRVIIDRRSLTSWQIHLRTGRQTRAKCPSIKSHRPCNRSPVQCTLRKPCSDHPLAERDLSAADGCRSLTERYPSLQERCQTTGERYPTAQEKCQTTSERSPSIQERCQTERERHPTAKERFPSRTERRQPLMARTS